MQRSLRRADHSSRGVPPTVMRRCVWSRNLVKEEAMAHWGGGCHAKRKKAKDISVSSQARQDCLTLKMEALVLLRVPMIYQSTRRNSLKHLDLRYWSYEHFGLQTLLAKFKKNILHGYCCSVTTTSTYPVSENHFTAHKPHLPNTYEHLPCVWKVHMNICELVSH